MCFITCNMSLVLEINYLILSYLINTWSTNGSKLTVMQNVVISVKTNMKKFLYLAFENSVMFQMFQYFIKGIIIILYTVIVLTNSQLLTCNSINLCNI